MKRLLTLFAAALTAAPALAQAPAKGLFFSEYVEGSSNNKALEIYNPTGSPITMDGAYSVQMYFNGSSTAGLTIHLTGTVAPGDVFVLAHGSAAAPIRTQADQSNSSGWFDGDDAIALWKGTDIIDVIGQIGIDPGSQWGSGPASTADNTLHRKMDVCSSDADGSDAFNPSASYTGFANNTIFGLGFHMAECGGGDNATPQFTTLPEDGTDAHARRSYAFTYAAADPDNEPLTFSLVSGPAGVDVTAWGELTWTPSVDLIGQSVTVTVAVTDGKAETTATTTLDVISSNLAPSFTSNMPDTLIDGTTALSIHYAATDADGDALTFDLLEGPAGASLETATGLFTWTATDAGVYPVTVTATDGESVVVARAYVGVRGTLFAGQTGGALRESLRGAYTPAQTLGYDAARDRMYAEIDLGADGLVRGVYTGFAVPLTPGADPSTDMNEKGISAEHTLPQSMGAEAEPGRSDLHNLFPSRANVNSARSNKPYGEIPDDQTETWYRGAEQRASIPDSGIDEYSENADGLFEPREAHKGNAARAALYFYTIYEPLADLGFLLEQKEDLIAWDGLDDADGAEVRRTGMIAAHQGNINPFILDTTLAARATVDVLPPDPVSIAAARGEANGTVVTVEGIVTRAEGRFVRVQDQSAGLTLFQSAGRLVAAVAGGAVAPGDLLRVTGAMDEFNGLRQMRPTLFRVLSRGQVLPELQTVTLSEIAADGEAYESELIRVLRLRIITGEDAAFAASRTYAVSDPTLAEGVVLRTPAAADGSLDGEPATALPVYFEGVLSRFRDEYQLQPVRATDIVRDTQAPVIRVDAGPMVLARRNHKMVTASLGALPITVEDGLFGPAPTEHVAITKVTSDEAARANGSGNTAKDIASGEDCRSVELRAERAGGGNGRVYTLHLAVADESGNVGTTTYAVHVPHDDSGRPVIDDGPAYEVATGCAAEPGIAGEAAVAASRTDLEAAALPTAFALEQNFPNPFAGLTTITVALPEAADVRLTVYNLLGQEVARIAAGVMEAGRHAIRFDADALGAGLYVYTLEAGAFRATRRMVVVK